MFYPPHLVLYPAANLQATKLQLFELLSSFICSFCTSKAGPKARHVHMKISHNLVYVVGYLGMKIYKKIKN